MSPTREVTEPQRMQCMEVWGGNVEANEHREMAGLDAWVYSRPYGGAVGGGDIYYLSSCASGRITRMLLADVSGHGDAAAGLAMSLRTLMRRNVNMISQRGFVCSMNQQFADVAEQRCFATAVVLSYFSPTHTLSLSNAGHPHPLLFRQATREWSIIDCDAATTGAVTDTPLGVVDSAEYSKMQIELATGDMVLCFSDALPESIDTKGEQLGAAGVLAAAQSLAMTQPAEIIPELCEMIRSQHADNLLADDTTFVLLRASGSSPSIKDNLYAPLRMLRSVRDETKLETAAWAPAIEQRAGAKPEC